jgi:hypothetical protein
MGEKGEKENDGGVNSSMMYLIYCKNFCKCHIVPSAQQYINKTFKIKKSDSVLLLQLIEITTVHIYKPENIIKSSWS